MEMSFNATSTPEQSKKQRIYYLAEENINRSSKNLLFEKVRKNEGVLLRLKGKLESWAGPSPEILTENINIGNTFHENNGILVDTIRENVGQIKTDEKCKNQKENDYKFNSRKSCESNKLKEETTKSEEPSQNQYSSRKISTNTKENKKSEEPNQSQNSCQKIELQKPIEESKKSTNENSIKFNSLKSSDSSEPNQKVIENKYNPIKNITNEKETEEITLISSKEKENLKNQATIISTEEKNKKYSSTGAGERKKSITSAKEELKIFKEQKAFYRKNSLTIHNSLKNEDQPQIKNKIDPLKKEEIHIFQKNNENYDKIPNLDEYSTEKTMNYMVTPEKLSDKPCLSHREELIATRKASHSLWDSNFKKSPSQIEISKGNLTRTIKSSKNEKKSDKKIKTAKKDENNNLKKSEWDWPVDRRDKICRALREIDQKFKFLKAKLKKESIA